MKPKRKDVFSRLKNRIDSIPMVDIHSHIDGEHPNARDPREILFYHYLVTELCSAGMPRQAVSSDLSVEEAVKGALPYFPLVKNTSTHWCLIKMLRELYGFEDDEINDGNWRGLLEAIYEGTKQKDRYKWILTEKAKIKKTLLTFRYYDEVPRHDPQLFVGSLRLDPMIGKLDKDGIQGLEKAVDTSIGSLDDFEDSLSRLFKKFSKCAAATADFPPQEILTKPSKAKAKISFKKLLTGRGLKPAERRTITSFTLRKVLSLTEEADFPFQVMIGVRRPVSGAAPPDYAISAFEPRMISQLCPLFHDFSGVKFDIFLANEVQSHELAVVAKNYPNVHVSGYWWYVFYPVLIKKFLQERLQMLPRNKSNGFFSDAYVVEWSYAKSSMVRLQLATVLTEMTMEGYFTEELAESLAVDLLNRNPEKLYKLA